MHAKMILTATSAGGEWILCWHSLNGCYVWILCWHSIDGYLRFWLFCMFMGYWPYHEFIMLVCVKHGHTDQSARRWRRASQASQAVRLAKMLADGVGGQGAAMSIRSGDQGSWAGCSKDWTRLCEYYCGRISGLAHTSCGVEFNVVECRTIKSAGGISV